MVWRIFLFGMSSGFRVFGKVEKEQNILRDVCVWFCICGEISNFSTLCFIFIVFFCTLENTYEKNYVLRKGI